MTNIAKKLTRPSSEIIERTAAEMCALYYEVGRSQGLKTKYKTHKAFVHKYLENFIPMAVDSLVGMLGDPNTPDIMKEEIFKALEERKADPELDVFNEPVNPFKEVASSPIIINTESISSRFERK
jgi:hypothetical protein